MSNRCLSCGTVLGDFTAPVPVEVLMTCACGATMLRSANDQPRLRLITDGTTGPFMALGADLLDRAEERIATRNEALKEDECEPS